MMIDIGSVTTEMNLGGRQHVVLDPARLVDKLLVQANSGGGKSWLLRRIIEQSQTKPNKMHAIVLDPEGEFSTLRKKFDFALIGKGPNRDVNTSPKSAAMLARLLMESRCNAVIDLYELSLGDRRLFVKHFCEALVNLPKDLWHQVLIVLDEVHVFCPEASHGESCSTDAVKSMMSLGRKRGFCAILATQRLSKLNKDAAAECNNVLIGRTVLDVDQKRAMNSLGDKKLVEKLRRLKPGQFYAYGPAFRRGEDGWACEGVEEIQVADVLTPHPQVGEQEFSAPAPSKSIQAKLKSLADLETKADVEINDMAAAKVRIRELEQKLKEQPKPAAAPLKAPKLKHVTVKTNIVSPKQLTALEKTAARIQKHFANAIVVSPKQIETLQKISAELTAQFTSIILHTQSVVDVVSQVNVAVEEMKGALRKAREQPSLKCCDCGGPIGNAGNGSGRCTACYEKMSRPFTGAQDKIIAPPRSPAPKISAKAPAEPGDLNGPMLAILKSLSWFASIGIHDPNYVAVASVANYSSTSSSFEKYRASLRIRGLIEISDGKMSLTEAGRKVAPTVDEAVTTASLHEKVLAVLKGPERKILRPLLTAYPSSLTHEDTATAADYSVTSSSFEKYRASLRTKGFIELSAGTLRAADFLFITERGK